MEQKSIEQLATEITSAHAEYIYNFSKVSNSIDIKVLAENTAEFYKIVFEQISKSIDERYNANL